MDDQQIGKLRELFAEVSEKAQAFNSLMITAGYASFFLLWQETKPYANNCLYATAGLLLVISASIFVGFHGVNLYVMTRGLIRMGTVMGVGGVDPDTALADRKGARIDRQNRIFLKAWPFVVAAIAAPLAIALVIVGSSYALQMFRAT